MHQHQAAVSAPSNASRPTSPELEPSAANSTRSMAKLPASGVEALWPRMAAIYPHTWTSALGDRPNSLAASTWASALAGITHEQLAEGLRGCIAEGREFPPSAGRFRAMCLGIPSLAAVKADLLTPRAQRSRFTLLVWRFIDTARLRVSDQRIADRMLADAYDIAREQTMRGVPLPERPLELKADEPEPFKPAAPEVALAKIEECRELLGKTEPEAGSEFDPPIDKFALEQELRDLYAPLNRHRVPGFQSLGDALPDDPLPDDPARACAFDDQPEAQ